MIGAKLPGVPCPACGGGTMVYSSRPNALSLAGGIRRRRRCLACRAKFTTLEERVPDQQEEGTALAAAAEIGRDYLALDKEGRQAVRRILDALSAQRSDGQRATSPHGVTQETVDGHPASA